MDWGLVGNLVGAAVAGGVFVAGAIWWSGNNQGSMKSAQRTLRTDLDTHVIEDRKMFASLEQRIKEIEASAGERQRRLEEKLEAVADKQDERHDQNLRAMNEITRTLAALPSKQDFTNLAERVYSSMQAPRA